MMIVVTRMCSVCDVARIEEVRAQNATYGLGPVDYGIYIRDYCPKCLGIHTDWEHPLWLLYEEALRLDHDRVAAQRHHDEIKERHDSLLQRLRTAAAGVKQSATTAVLLGVDTDDALSALREIAEYETQDRRGDPRRGFVELARVGDVFTVTGMGMTISAPTATEAAKTWRRTASPTFRVSVTTTEKQ